MSLKLVQAEHDDVRELVEDLRSADREEWEVGTGSKPIPALLHRLIDMDGLRVKAVRDEDDFCIAMWGHSVRLGLGNAWMLCTNGAVKRVHSMHRLFKNGIQEMHEDLPQLVAWAYYRNSVHIEWMMRMGFKYAGDATVLNPNLPKTHGIFLKFTREAKDKT